VKIGGELWITMGKPEVFVDNSTKTETPPSMLYIRGKGILI